MAPKAPKGLVASAPPSAALSGLVSDSARPLGWLGVLGSLGAPQRRTAILPYESKHGRKLTNKAACHSLKLSLWNRLFVVWTCWAFAVQAQRWVIIRSAVYLTMLGAGVPENETRKPVPTAYDRLITPSPEPLGLIDDNTHRQRSFGMEVILFSLAPCSKP